jgi:AraC-like DNA-binding protein
MSHTLKAISLNYDNIPVVSYSETNSIFGEFICTPADRRNHYEPSLVEVISKDMYLPNFALRFTEGKIGTDAIMFNEVGSGIDLPGSCMFLKGNFTSILPNGEDPLAGYHGTQNFKYDPDNQFRHIIHGDKQFQLLHISYKEEYLNYFLPENEPWADQLRTKIRNRERVFGERAVHISAEQEMALQTIFNNPLNGKLGYLMLEAAVVQIILFQLNGLFRNYQSKGSRTEKRDEESAWSLKEHLSENFLDDHSLESLAQMFCMNTNKLMSVFKKQFHKSIFEYIQELRMRHAYGLLLEDMQVTEVARVLGYKNPNHFSAAFKREFGVVPTSVKSTSKREVQRVLNTNVLSSMKAA